MGNTDFESIKRINILGHEYWSARDLQAALGYEYWQNFERVIQKAMIAATAPELGIKPEDHFTAITMMIIAGKGAKKPKRDYFLSRRACYLIAQNGDPEKPEIKAAQNFFAFTAEVYDEFTRLHQEQEQRLQLRLKIADENTQLSGTAIQSGVKSANMGLFHDAGYVGMYTMTSGQLGEFWKVPQGVEILDIMGPEALAANLFRITATDAKLKRDQVKNESIAIATHHDVGASVRRAMEEIHQQKPEDLPRAENIRKLVEEERRKERKRVKHKPPDEQGTLFWSIGFDYECMPTQEERLAALEKNTAESIHELQASTTIMLGVMQSQGQDIKRILLRLDSMEGRQSVMDGRLNILDGRLNFLDTRLAKVEQTLDEHTMRFDRVETLLGQILARLPEPA